MYDLIFRGGVLYDGAGSPGTKTDLGVAEGKIAAIGDLEGAKALRVVDAKGLAVAPGFIDTHSHSDLRLLVDDPPDVKLLQGITTEVLGQDGISVAPIVESDIPLYTKMLQGLLGDHDVEWRWRSVRQYLDELDRKTLPLNVSYLVPHGPVRSAVMGMEDRHCRPDEARAMCDILDKALSEGACGFSTGLIYPPCSYSHRDELVELCKVTARYDVPFVVHMRDEGYMLLEAIDEVVDVAERSGVHLHISHLKLLGRSAWDKAERVLEKLEAKRQSGVRITADQYPYFAGCTLLTAVLPTWTFAGGTEALLARLKDPDEREEIKRWFQKDESEWGNRARAMGWNNIVVSWLKSEQNQVYVGKSLEQIAEMRNSDPGDAAMDLLSEENLAVTQITFYGTEETIAPIMVDPYVTVCTDGIYGGKPHPRLYGAFPRVLGKYVRQMGRLTLAEAIRKMTSLPARTFGLERKGLLEVGYDADITVFDPDEIIDNATFSEPEQTATGVMWVSVDGKLVVEDGVFNKTTPGKAIRVDRKR